MICSRYSQNMKMILTIIGAFSIASVTAAQAGPFKLRSHEATYAMKQVHQAGRNWSAVEQAQGMLRYRFKNVCDGWTVEHQSNVMMNFENAQQSQMKWNYTSWEARDGKRIRFHSRMKQNGVQVENFSGEARFEEGKGVVVYTNPDGRREDIPQGTRFPTTHLIESIERAQKGDLVFSSPYFDGSGEDAFFNVDAVMPPYTGKALHAVKGTTLDPSPAWDMQLSFHQPGSQDSIASTQIGARYRKDGIATRLVQDFGDLVLVGDLVELTYLDEPTCE